MRTEPCLLCGGSITADPDDPFLPVLAHVRSERHQVARHRRPVRRCESCRAVTIPAWRSVCRFCARSEVAA